MKDDGDHYFQIRAQPQLRPLPRRPVDPPPRRLIHWRRTLERGDAGMPIRAFRAQDAEALVALSMQCARGEADFVLNPLWESADELFAEFAALRDRSGRAPARGGRRRRRGARAGRASCASPAHRPPACSARSCGATSAAAASAASSCARRCAHGAKKLGIQLAAAGIGTRNRARLFAAHEPRLPSRAPAFPDALRRRARHLRRAAVAGSRASDVAPPGDAGAILELYAACGFEPRSLAAHAGGARRRPPRARRRARDGRVVAFVELETHWPQRRLGGLRRRRSGAARARASGPRSPPGRSRASSRRARNPRS